MNNLHISLTEFRNESRVLKETQSLLDGNIFSRIHIAALWSEGLAEKETIADNITLNRFKLATRKYNKSLLVQAIKYIEFCYKIFQLYRKENIKVVNIHALSLLPLGILLKHSYRAKLVYDAHELETETNGLRGIRKKLAKKLEKLLIKSVDLTIVVSEPIADWYQDSYNIERPIVVLNAPKMIDEPKSTNYFREHFNIPSDKLLVLYQGGLAKGRGIELLLETFKTRKANDAVIVFLGYGELETQIKTFQQNSTNIFFHPAVSPQVLLQYTASADIGVSFIENTCLSYYYCLPNKLFEYSMVGLPVIVSNMQEMQRFVNQYEIGIVVDKQTPEALNQAIDKLLTMDLTKLKHNARQAAIQYSWEVQAKKMLAAYHQLLTEST